MLTRKRLLLTVVASLGLVLGGPGLVPAAMAGKDKSGSAASNVYRFPTTGAPGGQPTLNLFLPGTHLTPGQSTAYLDASASFGFHTIGLAYENAKNINKICVDSKDPDCNGDVRREIVFGTDESSLVNVSPAASIVGRLKTALADRVANDPSHNWGQFRTIGGDPDWPKIVVSGHSQGAGHAAILGIDLVVKRVAMIAGPNDKNRVSKGAPVWERPGRTPTGQWRGLGSLYDTSLPTQKKAWTALGLAGDVSQQDVPTGATRLITTKQAANDDDHFSLVVDSSLVGGTATPVLKPSWRYLLGA